MQEDADNNCVYRNEVQEKYSEVIDPSFAEDPTRPRNKAIPCPRCNSHGAVYILVKLSLPLSCHKNLVGFHY